jgi:hypothetical protein
MHKNTNFIRQLYATVAYVLAAVAIKIFSGFFMQPFRKQHKYLHFFQ